MNRHELIKKLSLESGATQATVETVLNALVSIVTVDVRDNGDTVPIKGLGVFKQKITDAHEARDPWTGGKVSVPARRNITFKVSSNVKVDM